MISKCLENKYPGNSIPGAGQWVLSYLNRRNIEYCRYSGKNIAQLSPRKQDHILSENILKHH